MNESSKKQLMTLLLNNQDKKDKALNVSTERSDLTTIV